MRDLNDFSHDSIHLLRQPAGSKNLPVEERMKNSPADELPFGTKAWLFSRHSWCTIIAHTENTDSRLDLLL
jgi:hypothetical protein